MTLIIYWQKYKGCFYSSGIEYVFHDILNKIKDKSITQYIEDSLVILCVDFIVLLS